jgi:predicted extracellular nuclease
VQTPEATTDEGVATQSTTTIIAQWTFEGDSLEPSTGEGMVDRGSGLGNEGFVTGNPGRAWTFNNWSLSGLDDTRWVEFAVSTEGFEGISFSFDANRSGTGPRTFEIHYSTDGETFTQLPSTLTSVTNDNWNTYSFNLSDTSELDDQERLALRIYGYGATGPTGTWRFDNVTFSSTTDESPVGEEPDVCTLDYTPIADIWTGDATGNVTVQGVVTADFRNGLNGFFIQDVEGEGFPNVSDGIFVFTPSQNLFSSYELVEGDLLRVSASTGAFQGARQLTFVQDIVTCDSDIEVTPVALTLPLEPEGRWPYVGMLTTLPQDLVVTENFLLGRFGMLSVAEGGRLYHPNNGNVEGTPEETRASNIHRRLVIDDGSTQQNPDEVPFLEVGGTIRIGDTMQGGITGVMSYGRPATFDASGPEDFRLHALNTTAVAFEATNPRPLSPEAAGGNITVSSYNVLNYFVTYPSENPLARGARNDDEFRRQRTKLINAIKAIEADILGLIEMENEDVVQAHLPPEQRRSAVQDLVDGLNEAYGYEAYAVMPDPEEVGTDAIKQAIIYKPGSVTFLAAASDTDPVHNRPPVAGTFRQNEHPFGAVSLVVVHNKSKRCSEGWEADPETQFEGCFNNLRVGQMSALRAFVADLKEAHYDTDVVVMGDMNAYNEEDPITTFVESGMVNLNMMIPDEARYSFVFDGEAGTLDYAFASTTMAEQVTGVTIWHINSDEPRVLEYDQVRFGPYDPYHDDSLYRSSDHDPVILGADLIEDDLLDALIGDVKLYRDTSVLTTEQANGLLAKLENAQAQLERGTPGSRLAARNMLLAFQNEVRSLMGEGVLSEAQGSLLAAMAQAVRDSL